MRRTARAGYAFQSTPSGGKATSPFVTIDVDGLVSIHAFRGEGDMRPWSSRRALSVSIHAFRGEGDRLLDGYARGLIDVSIHAFRGEGDMSSPTLISQRE